ncbi:MAG: hypothetical protein ACIARR_06740 [Phycisphaerales bacterium JB059]
MSKSNRSNDGQAPRKRRGRKLLIALGLLLVLLVAGVLALPTIGAAVAPGIIASRGSDAIAGRIEVGSVGLSWTGTQRVRGVRLYDPEGVLVAELDVSAGAGLLALAGGSRDLGTIELSGVIKADRNDAGEPRFMNAIASPTGAPTGAGGTGAGAGAGSPSVPSSLNATLDITSLRVEEGADALMTLTGEASVASGRPVTLALRPAFPGAGTGQIDATITDLIDADGVIDVNAMSVQAKASLGDVPTSLVQAFNPSDTDLPALLGERFSADLLANGSLETMDASVAMTSAGVNGAFAINIRDRVATRTGESSVRVSGERAARAIPALRQALVEGDSIRFSEWPDATLTVSQLRVPIDAVQAGTYEGVLAEMRLQSTPATARVPLSGGAVGSGLLNVSQMVLHVASEDVSQGINIAGAASATLDGKDAGQITIQNVHTGPLFDETGALRDPMSIGVRGEISVVGLAAETVQPFLDASGLSVADEIGPVINASLKASSEEGSEALHLTLVMDGAKVEGAARVILEGSSLRGDPSAPAGRAVTLLLTDPSATLTRVLAESGVRVEQASRVMLVIESLALDLDAFSGQTPDLRSFRASGSLTAPALVASIDREGATQRVTMSGLDVKLQAPESIADLSAEAAVQLGVDGGAPAGLNASLNATDLLSPDGALDIWGATVNALVRAPSIPAGAIDALLPPDGPSVRETLGQTVSLSAGLEKAPGRDSPATLDLSAESQRATLRADLIADRQRVRTGTRGIELNTNDLGALIGAFAELPEHLSLTEDAQLNATLSDLQVPMVDGRPSLERAAFETNARIVRFGVRSTEGTKPRANARPIELSATRAAGEDLRFRLTSDGVVLKGLPLGADPQTGAMREAPTSEIRGLIEGSAPWDGLVSGSGADVRFTLDGALSDEGGAPLAAMSGGGLVRAPTLDRVDVNLKATVDNSAAVQDALALGDLLTGLFGPSAALDVSLASDAFDPGDPLAGSRLGLKIDSPRMKTSAPVRLVGDDASLRLENASALTWRVAPEWATARLAGGAEPTLRVTRPVDLRIDLQRFVMPRGEGGRLDVQLGATSSDIALTTAQGETIEYTGLDATARSTQTPGELAINATMKNKAGGDDALSAELTIAGVGVEGQTPAASGLVVITALPSTVADSVAGANGKLAMLLGTTADVRARLVDFPRDGGTAKGSVKGVNSTMTFDGKVEQGTFVATSPAVLNVRRVDREFGFELAKIVPVFGGLTKQEGTHAPGRVIVSPLRIPVDGRDFVEHSSATIKIDPGEANLQLDGGLGRFLNLGGTGQTIGRRLQAFDVRYDKGVASYDNVVVPIGEFEMTARGNVNLVRKTQDVRVALPIGALAAEIAPGAGGIGAILDATGGVSLANTGTIGESGWELKLGGGGGAKPDPGKLLEGILGGGRRGEDGGG